MTRAHEWHFCSFNVKHVKPFVFIFACTRARSQLTSIGDIMKKARTYQTRSVRWRRQRMRHKETIKRKSNTFSFGRTVSFTLNLFRDFIFYHFISIWKHKKKENIMHFNRFWFWLFFLFFFLSSANRWRTLWCVFHRPLGLTFVRHVPAVAAMHLFIDWRCFSVGRFRIVVSNSHSDENWRQTHR